MEQQIDAGVRPLIVKDGVRSRAQGSLPLYAQYGQSWSDQIAAAISSQRNAKIPVAACWLRVAPSGPCRWWNTCSPRYI